MDFDATGTAVRRLALIAGASITCLMGHASAGAPLDLQVGIATDLSFIEKSGDKNSEVAGFPRVQLSRLGRRHRNMDDDQSFERQQGMDERVFPG